MGPFPVLGLLMWLGVPSIMPMRVDHAPRADSTDSELARDVARAMLIHDGSIRSLDWTQTIRYDVPPPTQALASSAQCFDERGRWAIDVTTRVPAGPTAAPGEEVVLRERMVCDGSRMATFDLGTTTGKLTQYTGQRRSQESVDCWLGRHLEVDAQSRLGELLLGASDLALSFSARGLPVVSGSVLLDHAASLVEVEVDPDHGFAPRVITVRDRAILVPHDRYETDSYTEIGGIWLPERGTVEKRMFAPTPAESRLFAEAVSRRGLARTSDYSDPEIRRLYADVVQEVYGAREARSAPLAPRKWLEVTYTSLNRAIDEGRFTWSIPEEYRMLDLYIGASKSRGSNQWRSTAPNPGPVDGAGPSLPRVGPSGPTPTPPSARYVRVHELDPADRGPMPIASLATRRVALENTHEGPINLRVVGTSCPGTIARLDRAALDAQETTTFTLQTRVAEVGAPQWYTATIEAAPASPGSSVSPQRIAVEIGYTPDIEVIAHPHAPTMIGVPGEPASIDIIVRRLDGIPADVKHVRLPGDWVEVTSIHAKPGWPAATVVTLVSRTDTTGVWRGQVTIQLQEEPLVQCHVDLSLRVEDAFAPAPAGLVWIEPPKGWRACKSTVRLERSAIGGGGAVPLEARLSTRCPAVTIEPIEPVRDENAWLLSVAFDPLVLGASEGHGSREIEVTGADGRILCRVPLVWFSRSALVPPTP